MPALVGLALLLVLDAALVAQVLHGQSNPGGDGNAVVETTNRPSPSAEPTETQPRGQGGMAPPPEGQPADRALVSAGAGGAVAWARAGACKGPQPTLRLSPDGSSFATVDVPATSLLRVRSVSRSEAWVVGTDAGCVPRFLRTVDGGATWQRQESTATAWHLLRAGHRDLHAPGGVVRSPCRTSAKPVDLSAFGTSGAAVLCDDGVIQVTADDGATWARAATQPTAAAVTYFDAETAFAAAAGAGGCDGTSVLASTDGGSTWQPRGCVNTSPAGVAASFRSAEKGLLATGDALFATADGGRSWRKEGPSP